MTLFHGRNLALYAAAYKAFLAVLTRASGQSRNTVAGSPTSNWHPFVAGSIASYFVFGRYSGVNYQVQQC